MMGGWGEKGVQVSGDLVNPNKEVTLLGLCQITKNVRDHGLETKDS